MAIYKSPTITRRGSAFENSSPGSPRSPGSPQAGDSEEPRARRFSAFARSPKAASKTTAILYLVVDTSGSMSSSGRISKVQSRVKSFTEVKGFHQMALYSFEDTLQPVVALTTDRKAVADGASKLIPRGGTRILTSLLQLLEQIEKDRASIAPPLEVYVSIMTDAEDDFEEDKLKVPWNRLSENLIQADLGGLRGYPVLVGQGQCAGKLQAIMGSAGLIKDEDFEKALQQFQETQQEYLEKTQEYDETVRGPVQQTEELVKAIVGVTTAIVQDATTDEKNTAEIEGEVALAEKKVDDTKREVKDLDVCVEQVKTPTEAGIAIKQIDTARTKIITETAFITSTKRHVSDLKKQLLNNVSIVDKKTTELKTKVQASKSQLTTIKMKLDMFKKGFSTFTRKVSEKLKSMMAKEIKEGGANNGDKVMEERLIKAAKQIEQQLADIKSANTNLEASYEKLKTLISISEKQEKDLEKQAKALENLSLHLDELEGELYDKL